MKNKLPENFVKLMEKSSTIIGKELDEKTINSLTDQYNYSLEYISKNPSNLKLNGFINFFYDVKNSDLEGWGIGIGIGKVINPFALSFKDNSYIVEMLSELEYYPDSENLFSDNFDNNDVFLNKEY